MEREPDLTRLREVAAEFELRQVIQRLEDEWERRVPGRVTQERIELEAEEGTLADLARGRGRVRARAAPRWAAYDGERLLVGDAPGAEELRDALASHPLLAHDAKSLGEEGPRGLLGSLAAGSFDLAHDTMLAAYLIDPARRTYELAELAADEGLSVAKPDGEEEAADDGQLSLGARGGGAGARGPGRGGAARLGPGRAPAGEARRPRARADHGRGRDAADRGPRRDGARGDQARHGAPRGDLRRSSPGRRSRCRPRSGRSPAASSRSAPRSSSARSSSTSSG